MEENFKKLAEKAVLFCHITSHVEGHKYPDLLDEKGGEGFPYIVVMDAEGNVIAQQGYERERSLEEFEKTVQMGVDFLELKKKAAGGDKGALYEVLVAELDAGSVKAADAVKRVAELGELKPEQLKELNTRIANVEVSEVSRETQKETQRLMAARFLEMKKAGRVPTDEEASQQFWIIIMNDAEERKDVGTFEEALKALKTQFGDEPEAEGFFEQAEKKLKKLKGQ